MFAESGDLQVVVGRVELDERREAVNGVPKAGDKNEKEDDGGDGRAAERPAAGGARGGHGAGAT